MEGRSRIVYEQAAIPVADPLVFDRVRDAINKAFAAAGIETFLKSLDRGKLRIRDFEAVLTHGKLGSSAAAEYAQLNDGDQGQIREGYLAALEQVPLPLRDKYFRLYAYY